MEEPALLVAVQGVVGGIEVKNDLLGRRAVRVEKDIDEDMLHRLRIVADLMVAGASLPRRVLQPVDRALPRQRRAILALRLQLVGEQRQHRITAKDIVVVDVLVAQRDRDEALSRGKRALELFIVEGVKTTIPLHLRLLDDPDVRSGRVSTKWLERWLKNAPPL